MLPSDLVLPVVSTIFFVLACLVALVASLRDRTCVFPGCGRDSRSCDLDHIVAYLPISEGGPPGQTRASNLAPLCRTHHRVKTHSPWTYRRHRGGYIWTSPTGHTYTVTTHSRRPRAH